MGDSVWTLISSWRTYAISAACTSLVLTMVRGVIGIVEQRFGGSNPVAKTMRATVMSDNVIFIIVALVEEDMLHLGCRYFAYVGCRTPALKQPYL